MIIKTYQLEKLEKQKANFFLLYGENEGFKNQVIENILKFGFTKNINRYDENEVINSYDDFISEVTNKSFFDNKKIIIITRASEKINKFLEDILDKKIIDIKIIINAGILDKKSKLRSNFEKKENLICIPFYADNNLTLAKLANNFFREKKISISQETVNVLAERCRGDRKNLINELLKIESFSKNKNKITIDEIIKLTNLAENYSFSELVDSCLSKNLKKTTNILNENNFTSDDCIAIVRIMLSKAKRLLSLKEANKKNNNIDQIISNFKPTIFWKDKDVVKIQMKNWSLESVYKLIYKINDLELLIKKNNNNSINILNNFILTQARVNN